MQKTYKSEYRNLASDGCEIVDLQEAMISRVGSGLKLLLDSFAYARKLAEDPWEFSVEWPELQRLGFTCNDSRWLIHKGIVRHGHEITAVGDTNCDGSNGNGSAALLTPKWDRDRRQLRLGASIIKEFKVPAVNQEIVLAVFEEEHWPPKIDDPLPRKPDIDPQRRLHDTINSLNRRQRHRLLHFGADGLGRGIRWDMVEKLHSKG
jgi:hypothetical protein